MIRRWLSRLKELLWTGVPDDRRSSPFSSGCTKGEICYCGRWAVAKVEEVVFHDDPYPTRHPLTAYLCTEHFNRVMRRWR